jgi:hypothetical protein
LAVKTHAQVKTRVLQVNHVKMVAEAARLTATQLHQRASAQHSLKRASHAHQQVAPAIAKCTEVVKTAVATGRQRVVSTASHVTVQPVAHVASSVQTVRPVRSTVTSVQLAAMETTVAHVVNLVHAMSVQLATLMVHVVHSIVTTVVHVVNSVRAMTVHAVTSATVTIVHVALLMVTVRLVRSIATTVVHVVRSTTVQHVLSMVVAVRMRVAMLAAQTGWNETLRVSVHSPVLVTATPTRRLSRKTPFLSV